MKKVVCFGTFDLLHKGHLIFFQQAKELGDYLAVGVARDLNVEKIKGRRPKFNENQRLESVKTVALVDQVFLGDLVNPYKWIEDNNPDVIALGYDQKYFTENLKRIFSKIEIVKLKSYKPKIYKSSKLKSK